MEWEQEEEYVYPSSILDKYLDRIEACDETVLDPLTAMPGDRNNGLTANDLETLSVSSRMNRFTGKTGTLAESMKRWELSRIWFFKDEVTGYQGPAPQIPPHPATLKGGPGLLEKFKRCETPTRSPLDVKEKLELKPCQSPDDLRDRFEKMAGRLSPRCSRDVTWPLVGNKIWNKHAAGEYNHACRVAEEQRVIRETKPPVIHAYSDFNIKMKPPMPSSALAAPAVKRNRTGRWPANPELIGAWHRSNAHAHAHPRPSTTPHPMAPEQLAEDQEAARHIMERSLLHTLPGLRTTIKAENKKWAEAVKNRTVVGKYHGIRPLKKLETPAHLRYTSAPSSPHQMARETAALAQVHTGNSRNITQILHGRHGGSPMF